MNEAHLHVEEGLSKREINFDEKVCDGRLETQWGSRQRMKRESSSQICGVDRKEFS